MTSLLQALAGLGIGAIAVAVILGNWAIVFRWYLRGKTGSQVPFLGGLLGAAAILVALPEAAARWWWVPALADPGSAGLVVGALLALLGRRKS